MVYNKIKKNNNMKLNINKYKTTRDKTLKLKSSITFLIRCRNTGIIPQFITNSTRNIFRIFETNMITKSSIRQTLYKYVENFHNKVLNLLLRQKHELLRIYDEERTDIRGWIDRQLTDEESRELWHSENNLGASLERTIKEKHRRKFENLMRTHKQELEIKFNKKWFVNKTNIVIPEDVQWILSLGQKHGLPVRREDFPMMKYITDGEDFIQQIIDKEEQEITRTQFTNMIDNHLNKLKLNNRDKFTLSITKKATRFLGAHKNLLIVKADKGNVTVAIEKTEYEVRMKEILGDMMTYRRSTKDPTSGLQKKNNELVEELFRNKIITEIEKKRLKTETAIAPRIYGLPKIHKDGYPLRPICSSINSPSTRLCKYMTGILRTITDDSKYNVKDSMQFKEKLINVNLGEDEKLVSFDVVSLFPSIPVDLALKIIEDRWEEITKHTKIPKDLFLKIMKFCIKDNRYFSYNNKIYTQTKGLPMGSPASPIVADIVMEKLLDTVISNLAVKPKILTKYVDDLFIILRDSAIDEVLTKFNGFHQNIKFTVEKEINSRLPYLDILIIRGNNGLKTDWYQKPTASGRIVNFFSKHPKRIIINTAKNLINRILNLSDIEFHKNNLRKIRDILSDNNFPIKLTNKLISDYQKSKEKCIRASETPFIYKTLTYVPGISERFENLKLFKDQNIKIAHKTENNLTQIYSKTKDKIPKMEKSNVIYRIPCTGRENENCDQMYVGTTKNKLKTRISAHKSDQKLKLSNFKQKTALTNHCVQNKHKPDFDNVQILQTENNYKRRYMLEMLHIINLPPDKRMNFKVDTLNCALSYRHLITKAKRRT